MRELHNRFNFTHPLLLALITTACLMLQACTTGSGIQSQPWQETGTTSQQTQDGTQQAQSLNADLQAQNEILTGAHKTVKVAILLPLTGKHAHIGTAMLNASQMALFDLGFDNYELLPKDTQGTANGAHTAARAAIKDGATLVLGPLFSHSVRAARQVTQQSGVNMIAFSTDWTLANHNTFLIGFLPFDQIGRVINYASNAGLKRIGVLSPSGSYGNGVVSAYQAIAQPAGIQASRIKRFSPKGDDLNPIIRKFTDYDARKAAGNKHGAPYDAILMPVGGSLARQVGSFLSHYDLPPRTVKRLGTGLMDDKGLASDRTLDGSWFAAPAPSVRAKFIRSYSNVFKTKPPRITSLAYDATALSIILSRIGLQRNGSPAFDNASITNPSGFAGVDGIFRFRRDGIVERGLAILEYKNGGIVVIDNAPTTFQNKSLN